MKIPACFGRYAHFLYEEGAAPETCIQCELAEHCYRATTAEALNSLAADVGLLTDNLIEQGRISEATALGSSGDEALDNVLPRD